MALTPGQLLTLALEAGFRGNDAKTAAAIALAESGGNPTAYNPELASSYSRPGGGSRGLWQIFGSVHPKYNSSIAFQPEVNARAAFEIYSQAGNKFTPWSAFTQGTYKQYLSSIPSSGAPFSGTPGAAKISGGLPSFTSSPVIRSQTVAAGPSIGQAISSAISPTINLELPKVDWFKIGFIIGGGLLIFIGFMILAAVASKSIGNEAVEAAPELVKAAEAGAIPI